MYDLDRHLSESIITSEQRKERKNEGTNEYDSSDAVT